ncbi:MAG TPA: hypothetical protein VJP85_06535 [Candidatus Baltobacteraceae bacterium]|nr:hypothetical protein [Candidatus Baltobacteraceae bacterium]
MATAVVSPTRGEQQRSAQAAACVRLGFRLGDCVLGVDVADDAALRLLEEAYALLQCPAAGVRARALLQRLSDGRLHVRYGRHALRLTNAADPVALRAAYHAAREIFARFACEPQHAIAVYGALCEVDDGAVLLLGPTAIGKTLLALHLASAGARFLGDDTAVLSPASGEAYAMPRRPSLRESALPLLPKPELRETIAASPSYFETERGRFWYALDGSALGIEPCPRPYRLRAICVVRERGEEAAVRSVDREYALKLLAQRAYMRPTSLAQLGALARATRRAACFEMTLGTPESSAQALLHEVRTCA